MTMIRHPVATGFYPGDVRSQVEALLLAVKMSPCLPTQLRGVLVPHAGWQYSGATAIKTLYALSQRSHPKMCIIFGADHTGVAKHAIYPEGEWMTDLGSLKINRTFTKTLHKAFPELAELNADAHDREHSIEVLTPMIKYLFPDITIVPITVKPETSSEELGRVIASYIKERNEDAVIIASSDLTHYGSYFGFTPAGTGSFGLEWMQSNDHRMIKLCCSVSAGDILSEAHHHHNACGAGAVTALLRALSTLGIQEGHLIEYTTSHGSQPACDFTVGVGYAGIAF